MKKLFFILVVAALFQSAVGLAQQKVVTVILLRHAEKMDDGKDPELSNKGNQFAAMLAKLFADQKVDAVYTTAYKRTSATVKPLADENSITAINYDPAKSTDLVQAIEKSNNKTVVVVGHSNTINLVHNALIKDKKMQALGDDEYRKVFIIHYDKDNPANSTSMKLDLN
ncbi:MAG: histidine phosphatase family protein [Pedobacter sp.]|nr:MAG: histidine phosphatase family protein [Pedobacter sp.]